MSILSDTGIRAALLNGDISISPTIAEALQPCSIDLHLDPAYRRLNQASMGEAVDMNACPTNHTTLYANTDWEPIIVGPGEPILMSTLETVTLNEKMAAQIDGKSSVGRLFQTVHITAGWIDAGFSGQITLEVINHLNVPVIYYPGSPIAQLVVFRLEDSAENPYNGKGGHYQGQVGPVESKYRIPAYAHALRANALLDQSFLA